MTAAEQRPETPLMSAAEIAARLPDAVTEQWVARRMSSRRWPSTLLGRHRYMTEAQFQEALDLEAVEAHPSKVANASGLSPRSRHRRAS